MTIGSGRVDFLFHQFSRIGIYIFQFSAWKCGDEKSPAEVAGEIRIQSERTNVVDEDISSRASKKWNEVRGKKADMKSALSWRRCFWGEESVEGSDVCEYVADLVF